MSTEYFIKKFQDIPANKWTSALELCDEEERAYLITSLGCHVTAVEEGQLNYDALGYTGRDRILVMLERCKQYADKS